MATGFLTHDRFLDHCHGPGHPERADRLLAIWRRLQESGTRKRLVGLEPVEADRRSLTQIHSPLHIDLVERLSATGRTSGLTPDTGISSGTFGAARLASGGAITAVDAVVSGTVDNAFCAHRPPGHHAERDRAMGFCYFNHIAVAAMHLRNRHGIRRMAIIDWDVHHGNGTQHSFESDSDILFFSIHQYPHYPGTGAAEERGIGPGVGATLNVPVPAGTGDAGYARIFAEVLRPAIDAFRPEFLLLSAGFDAHRADPLGGMELTEKGFEILSEAVTAMARDHCDGRLVSLLEGGYDLQATAVSVDVHLQTLSG